MNLIIESRGAIHGLYGKLYMDRIGLIRMLDLQQTGEGESYTIDCMGGEWQIRKDLRYHLR